MALPLRPAGTATIAAIITGFLSISAAAADEVAQLDTLVVTATGGEHRLWGVPAAVTVIEGERLRERPAQDALELVRDAPGVSLGGVGLSGRKTIQLRGMESHQSLILIDGKRLNPSDAVIGHSDYQHGWVAPEAIERIEIVRGPMSSLYGSEALGGVINIITKPIPERWSGSARLLGGAREDGRDGERSQLAVNLGGPLIADTLALGVNASLLRQEDTPQRDNPDLTELEGREMRSGGISLAFTPNAAHTLRLEYQLGDEERWRDTVPGRGAPILHESSYQLDREHAAITHQGRFGTVATQLRAYRSVLEQTNSTDNADIAPTAPQKLTDEVVDGHIRLDLNDHQLTVGGEYRIESLEHEMMRGGEGDVTHQAVFVQDEWHLTETINLTLGLRADRHELFGTEFSPRGYLVYHPTDWVTVKGGYGHGFRAPTLKQISPEYFFQGAHSFSGNPDLKPEYSDSYEFGIEVWQGPLHASVTLFQNDVEDLIVNQCVQNCEALIGKVYEHANVAAARIRGVETELDTELPAGFTLAANYTYLNAEDRDSGTTLANRPRHTAGLRLGWAHRPLGLRTNLRTQYTGKQVVYVGGNDVELPAYTLWHAGVAKDLGSQLTLRVGVENLTDERLTDKSPHYSFPEQGRFYFAASTPASKRPA
ncbi:hypothetical protein CAI21_13720 [Alkalilimnicola ehrlichii]|uniref:TonB-dependent receptor n=1 Tax=Alkalilimnicola ehrlichii TaxID=351052 RepID=A0A3E0WQD5_9GAMM|nr:TonB-dependent receptor [Alkalilimnicola ehrlichii]RFA27972.1 hypothetical protein CAI21_13720 [Alkalilimnicola ehrlichii]RFA34619.1 hypothetical protein CAL65_14745 [Alkalilimnicola ehrlichii]